MESGDVANETAIYFKALPTCNRQDTCQSCLGTQEKLKVRTKDNFTIDYALEFYSTHSVR